MHHFTEDFLIGGSGENQKRGVFTVPDFGLEADVSEGSDEAFKACCGLLLVWEDLCQ